MSHQGLDSQTEKNQRYFRNKAEIISVCLEEIPVGYYLWQSHLCGYLVCCRGVFDTVAFIANVKCSTVGDSQSIAIQLSGEKNT